MRVWTTSFARSVISRIGRSDDCSAWFYRPAGPGPFPVVVMAHGLGAIREMGLAPFADRRTGMAIVVAALIPALTAVLTERAGVWKPRG